jgi:hypothetical protein
MTSSQSDTIVCVYCEEEMPVRADGLLAHDECSARYGGPPMDFMPGEDGYARERAWEARNRG